MKTGKNDRSQRSGLRDKDRMTSQTLRTSNKGMDEESVRPTRKPGSQSKSGGRHNNGRGGGK